MVIKVNFGKFEIIFKIKEVWSGLKTYLLYITYIQNSEIVELNKDRGYYQSIMQSKMDLKFSIICGGIFIEMFKFKGIRRMIKLILCIKITLQTLSRWSVQKGEFGLFW